MYVSFSSRIYTPWPLLIMHVCKHKIIFNTIHVGAQYCAITLHIIATMFMLHIIEGKLKIISILTFVQFSGKGYTLRTVPEFKLIRSCFISIYTVADA